MFLQGLALLQRIHQELVFLLGIHGVRTVVQVLEIVIAPVIIQLGEHLELLIEVHDAVLRSLARTGLDFQRRPFRREFLERRVLLEFLLDDGPQLQDRNLQDLEGLAQLGREHHLHPLALIQREGLCWHSFCFNRFGVAVNLAVSVWRVN